MAEEKKVWIQNGYRSSVEFIIQDEKTHEDESFVFVNYKTDRMSGRVLADGFTVISEDTYNMLIKKSKAFAKLIEDGTLIKYDEAPLSAMSDVDRILALQEEVRTLKDTIAALEEENAKLKKTKGGAQKPANGQKASDSDDVK